MEGTQLGFESESTRGFSFYEAIKRLIDIICSFVGILVLSPLFIIIAIIIMSIIFFIYYYLAIFYKNKVKPACLAGFLALRDKL